MTSEPNSSNTTPREPLLRGLIAATFTPMGPGGEVDLSAIPQVTEFVLRQGASGLFVGGSTGESPSLATEERMAVAEAYVGARNASEGLRGAPIVIHVGHNSLVEAARMAAHAGSIGADAIAMVPPSYFPPPSLDGLVDSLRTVAAAAPEVPLYYYHIPRLSRVGVRMIDLLERAERDLPTLAGIKFSSFELDDLIRCVHFANRRYNILFGADEMLLAGLAMGAAGAVGSTYNFLGPQYRAVIDAFEAGDIGAAQAHQHHVTAIVHRILAAGGGGAIKAAMGILGVNCGAPRLPIEALGAGQVAALRAGLEPLIEGAADLAAPKGA